jgi:hypothetical protein
MPTEEWYEQSSSPWWKPLLIYLVIALVAFLLIGKALRADAAMRCDAENGAFDNGTWDCVVEE